VQSLRAFSGSLMDAKKQCRSGRVHLWPVATQGAPYSASNVIGADNYCRLANDAW